MDDDGTLAAAVQARAAALGAGDGGSLRDLLHPDFVWTSHRGDRFDRASYLASNTGGRLRWRSQRSANLRMTVIGDTGVVTMVVRDEVERDGELATFRMPVTQTWVRSQGRWVCLAGHAGPLLDP